MRNALFMRNVLFNALRLFLCATLHNGIRNAMKRASSVWNNYQAHEGEKLMKET